MYMIVFDIEWNHGCDEIRLDEILQIGAVRLDRLGGKIMDTFRVNIRPSVHAQLGVAARQVLDLPVFLQAEQDFSQAMAAFCRWCGDEETFAAWGNSDAEVLRRNCSYWDIPCIEMETVYDIQASFSGCVGSSQRIALYRAAEYCGIPDCFDCHDALYDAVYTAVVGEWIPMDSLVPCALPRRIQRLSREKFPRQPRRRVGPFASKEAALESRESRRAMCPHCGKKIWIQAWNSAVPGKYYADFYCPLHGWHLCRLTLDTAENGMWRGRVAIPAATQNNMREFYLATKAEYYPCQPIGKKRKRRSV